MVLLHRLKSPGLAQQSYVLECGEGAAVVVDPRRDIDEYVSLSRERGLSIAGILETHRQEDFEYGSAALAKVTGARIITGHHELFGHGDLRLADGAETRIGTTRLSLLATAGHTPESVCYAVYPDQTRSSCWGVFTGDALFPGATGRTDLTDPARTGDNAGALFDAIHEKLARLDDGALVLAAHGPGSACGSNIADRDETTIGIEKVTNPVFTRSRAEFVREKCAERLPRPPYFSRMERVNLLGGRSLEYPPTTQVLQPRAFAEAMSRLTLIDTRSPDAFAASHIPGSYNIWLSGLASFAGWIAAEDASIGLILDSPADLPAAERALVRVGFDWPAAVLAGGVPAWREQGFAVSEARTISARECHDRMTHERLRVLDVRDQMEWEQGHVAGAIHTYVGDLSANLPPISRNEPLVVHCSVGNRSGLALSILERCGFTNLYNMLGGMQAWRSLQLPLTGE